MAEPYGGENLIFIMGPPRSGTTWTWSLLSSMPKFEPVLREDFKNFKLKNSAIKKMKDKDGFNTTESAIFFSNLSDEEIKRGIAYKTRRCKAGTYFFEKTPSNTFALDRITTLFPQAKIIYLLRDPRATVSSMIHTKLSSGHVIASNVNQGIEVYRKHYDCAKMFDNYSNLYRLKYEDLHTNTYFEFAKLLHFLQPEKKFSKKDITLAIKKNTGKLSNVKINAFRNGVTDGYKKELSKKTIHKIEDDLHFAMKDYGYSKTVFYKRVFAQLIGKR